MPMEQKRRTQKGRKQKGRRHRRVNRTPRPVTRTRPAEAVNTGFTGVTEVTEVVAVGQLGGVSDEETVFRPVQAGGIGRPAERTWQHLRTCGDTGASVDELSGVVGYQPATITRHVDGLAAHHLAQQRDGRWYAARAAAR
ncbi:hypothetical protein ABCR94_35665 [Streptomyces sp. 21So2-11]|uniref:hypothetical protein n=1 Tax=Streptomyces sp. 21So2-11 TaxID=3144408 RepID=UPI0032197F74